MEQKKTYSINEISKLLNIPKATIRYWENQGLITTERNSQNEYREFSLAVAMELSNISFFRKVDIPIKELKRMINSDILVQEELLEDAQQRMEERRKILLWQAEQIRIRQLALGEIRRLREQEICFGVPEFARVIEFSGENEEHWKRIIDNPGDFVLVFAKDSPINYQYGIGYRDDEYPKEEERIIWEAGNRQFYEGLLITDNRDEAKNNLEHLLQQLQKQGHKTGNVVAQYLTSGIRGQEELWDYYKTWIEI